MGGIRTIVEARRIKSTRLNARRWVAGELKRRGSLGCNKRIDDEMGGPVRVGG